MKKIIAISLLTTLVFAKFPHESDARTIQNAPQIASSQLSQLTTAPDSNWEYSREDMEGKILASEYLVKKDITLELSDRLFTILKRVSTVERIKFEGESNIDQSSIDQLVIAVKKLDKKISKLDLDDTDFKTIKLLEEETQELEILFEELISSL